MALGKLQTAGASGLDTSLLDTPTLNTDAITDALNDSSAKGSAVLYGAMAVGVLAGAAISTYLWRQRVRALNLLNLSPLERAEEIIANCESKLEDIERAFENIKGGR
ncbi:MAG: hypothetical protein JO316_06110 [Abitibacteriaceae bacterium]|nr:hypothetical protein [Abditibacteriaceae bacterium]